MVLGVKFVYLPLFLVTLDFFTDEFDKRGSETSDLPFYSPAYVNGAWPDALVLCALFKTRTRYEPPRARAF